MPNIHHEVVIAATAEKVYHALTTQEGLSAWWTPHTTAVPEVDAIARFAFGGDYFKEMRIVELRPFERVQWLCVAGAQEWIGTTIAFGLQTGDREYLLQTHPEAADQIQQKITDGPATILTLRHDNWSDYSPMFAECSYTWAQFLRSLKLAGETGTGRPWPHQHQ
ncbi:SRPBCC family protein [Niabella beijingensis]|uniref:SRPBCC family protein n=1 Tax=Niabella beijingensis TaxID=2872700 RepID=UPI001CBBD8FA|nr:SRPBCC domain-containing protein [Niabella beijingensis]MBZ4188118.1 SRPBCC domain-containing protein [Niabella beijingensis]